MTLDEVLKHFGSGYQLCKQLKITPTNYSKWKSQNWIPLKQQFMINLLLDEKLPIDPTKEEMQKRLTENNKNNKE